MLEQLDGRMWAWIVFNVLLVAMLVLDLAVLHREPHRVTAREAAVTSAIWIAVALVFNAIVYWRLGPTAGLQFFTGYIIEKALSVDNLFVFAVLFTHFRVPAESQHRVLFWGVVGALVMRGTLIFIGAELISRFHWIFYVFGAFLVFTGARMLRPSRDTPVDLERNPMLRVFRRFMPMTAGYEGTRFFVRRNGQLLATPLLLVLVIVETTDLVFAIDSIPAIFAITVDPFIVYTSNALAVLGLRALYFLLAHVIDTFRYLSIGLSVVLMFIGAKMLLMDVVTIPVTVSLAVVLGVLLIAVGASLFAPAARSAG